MCVCACEVWCVCVWCVRCVWCVCICVCHDVCVVCVMCVQVVCVYVCGLVCVCVCGLYVCVSPCCGSCGLGAVARVWRGVYVGPWCACAVCVLTHACPTRGARPLRREVPAGSRVRTERVTGPVPSWRQAESQNGRHSGRWGGGWGPSGRRRCPECTTSCWPPQIRNWPKWGGAHPFFPVAEAGGVIRGAGVWGGAWH